MRIAVAAIAAIGLFNHVNYNSMRYQYQRYDLRHWRQGSQPIRLTNSLDIFSSFWVLLIPMAMQYYTCLLNVIYSIVYSGVTCGKQLVVIIAQPKASAMVFKNQCSQRRLINLMSRLKQR
jgi:hypothetical protein